MRLEASDIRNLNLLKHYRIIRKWACKNNDLNDADLELLIYFDCMDLSQEKILKSVHILIVGTTDAGTDYLKKVGYWYGENITAQLKSIISIKFPLSVNN